MRDGDSSWNWQSISDMMSALMMIFLFISVLYMLQTQIEKAKMTEVAKAYSNTKQNLNVELKQEFKEDLKEWRASIEDDNTVRFYAPEVLFMPGSANIKSKFKEILNDFFPRYIAILKGKDFKNEIDEIRIEGHTSSEWGANTSFENRYLENLILSQKRSFEVLKYCFSLDNNTLDKEWLKGILRANGLSFARTINNPDGTENQEKSRRVEFKAIVKTKEKINEILEMSNGGK